MKAILFDANACIGCEACLEACREENHLPESPGGELSATRFTTLDELDDGTYFRQMCMHCLEPSCVSACPVGALHKSAEGPVEYTFDKCIGCRYCMVACPFSVPRYEWASTTPRVQKCNMCAHRVREGRPTACAEACPAEATIFGDREELLAEARRRIAEDPDAYADRIYGEEEAGGTSVLVIGSKAVMAAFDPNIPLESLPEHTWAVLSKIPTAVAVAGCGLLGVHWLYRRKVTLAEEAARETANAELATSGSGEGGRS